MLIIIQVYGAVGGTNIWDGATNVVIQIQNCLNAKESTELKKRFKDSIKLENKRKNN
jgi:hypothetical protein